MPELATKDNTDTIPSKSKTYRIKEQLDKFWDYCAENDYIPDVEILCKYLSVNRSTLWRWETSGNNKILCNLIKNIKNDIFAIQKQMALRNRVNATVFIFNAKNNFGYVDKIDHEHNSNTNITVSFNIPKVDTNIPIKTIEGQVIESTPIKQIK